QRLMNAMRQAHADGWFIVFDTLTLADDRLEAFYDNPNALRDYFRDIGRMVLAAEGRKRSEERRVGKECRSGGSEVGLEIDDRGAGFVARWMTGAVGLGRCVDV